MKNLITGILLLLSVSSTWALDTIGNISVIRATTDSNHNPEANKNIIIFKLTNTFESGCSWVSVSSGSSFFATALFSAEARAKSVKVWYNSHPSAICEAYNIELEQ